MKKTAVEEYVADPNHMRSYQQARAILEVTEHLQSVMEELGVNRTELAKRLGRSRGWVTQMLDGQANKTIRTIADAFAVLGREFHSTSQPIRIGMASATSETSPVLPVLRVWPKKGNPSGATREIVVPEMLSLLYPQETTPKAQLR